MSDKAIATLPADLKAQFDRKVKSEARVAVRNSLGKGVQTMLTNLFQLKTAQGQAKEDLQKQIDKNLENSPYLNSLKSAIEGYIKDNPQLDINYATRFRLGDEDFSKLFELSIEEIDERISSISTKLESGVSQTDRNTLSLNLNRLKLVKVILEADQDKVMQPKESDLEKIPEAAIQQLISDSLQEMFFSQQDLFRPKGDEKRTNNYQNYQNAAYRDFSVGKRQQSNTFMDQSVKSLVENDEWLEEFTQKISAQADNLTLDTSSLYVDMHARRSLQVEAALCRHALSSVLAGAGEGLDDAMKRLNGGAVQALITSNRRANSLDDSTLSGVVV